MKYLGISLIILFLLGCSKDNEKERVDFFLSQQRDSDLIGWWKSIYIDPDTAFTYYHADGKVFRGSKHLDGRIYIAHKSSTYWYAEGGVIHYYEYQSSWAYRSNEFSVAYKLSQQADSLYTKDSTADVFSLGSVKCKEIKNEE